MSTQRFWSLLVGTCAVTSAGLLLLDQILPDADAVSRFTLICVAVFALINVAAYLLGKGAAQSSSKYRFIHLMMFLIIIKMVICLALVLIYVRLGEPASKLFVIPFLMIYLTFTIFEIYVLQQLARLRPEGGYHNQQTEGS